MAEENSNFGDFMRLWTTDANGHRVLRGLTATETAEYQAYQAMRAQFDGGRDPWPSLEARTVAQDRWLALHDKHDRERLQVLSAEVELREGPTIN